MAATPMASSRKPASPKGSCPTYRPSATSTITVMANYSTATALGLRTGTLTIADTGNNSPQTVALSGTGVAAVNATPSNLSFGNQTVGVKSSAAAVTVTNNQSKNLTINSITSNLSDYTTSTACPLTPKALTPGASCERKRQ